MENQFIVNYPNVPKSQNKWIVKEENIRYIIMLEWYQTKMLSAQKNREKFGGNYFIPNVLVTIHLLFPIYHVFFFISNKTFIEKSWTSCSQWWTLWAMKQIQEDQELKEIETKKLATANEIVKRLTRQCLLRSFIYFKFYF